LYYYYLSNAATLWCLLGFLHNWWPMIVPLMLRCCFTNSDVTASVRCFSTCYLLCWTTLAVVARLVLLLFSSLINELYCNFTVAGQAVLILCVQYSWWLRFARAACAILFVYKLHLCYKSYASSTSVLLYKIHELCYYTSCIFTLQVLH
jgi:hypothetical protein